MRFTDIVSSEAELRRILGMPARRAVDKVLHALDATCRTLIARSPFVLIASGEADGMDVSPKGDPPGFVHVLDERTLAIPDRPGNRRGDTFRNVLANPRVGLLFLVPGRAETLRINGRATIVRDRALRDELQIAGKPPALVLVVSVDEAFVHCGRCVLRSGLWDQARWPAVADLPTHAQCLLDHARPGETLDELEASVRRNYSDELY